MFQGTNPKASWQESIQPPENANWLTTKTGNSVASWPPPFHVEIAIATEENAQRGGKRKEGGHASDRSHPHSTEFSSRAFSGG